MNLLICFCVDPDAFAMFFCTIYSSFQEIATRKFEILRITETNLDSCRWNDIGNVGKLKIECISKIAAAEARDLSLSSWSNLDSEVSWQGGNYSPQNFSLSEYFLSSPAKSYTSRVSFTLFQWTPLFCLLKFYLTHFSFLSNTRFVWQYSI